MRCLPPWGPSPEYLSHFKSSMNHKNGQGTKPHGADNREKRIRKCVSKQNLFHAVDLTGFVVHSEWAEEGR